MLPPSFLARSLVFLAIVYLAFVLKTAYFRSPNIKRIGSAIPFDKTSKSYLSMPDLQKNPSPFPTLFVSHGGPTFLYEDDDFGNKGAWRKVRDIGKKIKKEWKPDYVIVVSAHWQLSGLNLIEVAVPPAAKLGQDINTFGSKKAASDWKENPLIYDFHGFPQHMYKEQFRTWNSRFVSQLVSEHLQENGFHSRLTERGLDHGVWVPLKVAFPAKDNETFNLEEIPLVQVSLTGVESDFQTHARLGEALSHFQNYMIWDPIQERHLRGLIICSGMSVHNLRDLGPAVHSGKKALPYVPEFSGLVGNILQSGSAKLDLLNRLKTENIALLRKAHPTLEHFVPLVVAAGVHETSRDVVGDTVTELYNDSQLSLAWGTYQFGEYRV